MSAVASVLAVGGFVAMHGEVARLSYEVSVNHRRAAQPIQMVHSKSSAEDFPPFSAAYLVSTINSVANDMHLSFDEMSYVLESAPATPFIKYRITLTAGAGYTELRKFIPALSSELPHVSLDTIRCARPDLAATGLSCELSFSAYYSRADDA